MKFILFALVIAAIYYFLFFRRKQKRRKELKRADEMVECAGCGTLVVVDDAYLVSGKYYCSKECIGK